MRATSCIAAHDRALNLSALGAACAHTPIASLLLQPRGDLKALALAKARLKLRSSQLPSWAHTHKAAAAAAAIATAPTAADDATTAPGTPTAVPEVSGGGGAAAQAMAFGAMPPPPPSAQQEAAAGAAAGAGACAHEVHWYCNVCANNPFVCTHYASL
jgi:hypothetical protein